MTASHRAIVYAIAFIVFVIAVIVDLVRGKGTISVTGIIAIGFALLTLVPLVDAYSAT